MAFIWIMSWLYFGNDSSRPIDSVAGQERGADSSIIAKLGREEEASAPGSLRTTPASPPPQPPAPIVPQSNPGESELGQTGDETSIANQDGIASDEQDVRVGLELVPGGGRPANPAHLCTISKPATAAQSNRCPIQPVWRPSSIFCRPNSIFPRRSQQLDHG